VFAAPKASEVQLPVVTHPDRAAWVAIIVVLVRAQDHEAPTLLLASAKQTEGGANTGGVVETLLNLKRFHVVAVVECALSERR